VYDDYDVIGDVIGGHGLVIGRNFRATTAPRVITGTDSVSCAEARFLLRAAKRARLVQDGFIRTAG
jgi:hypothetical protein